MPEGSQLEKLLIREYGCLLSSMQVAHVLGYGNIYALAKARSRGLLPIQMFLLPGRRGWFCRTSEVAAWLSRLTERPTAQRPEVPVREESPRPIGRQRP